MPDIMPWDYLFNPNQRLFWGYLLSSAVIALLVTLAQTKTLPNWSQLKAYWWGREAKLDYQYFLAIWLVKVLIIAPLMLSAQAVAIWSYRLFSNYLTPIYEPIAYRWIVLAYSLSLFVVSDFTRYWLHRWLHTNRYLWAFHKVHHSAETLNPLTFYRIHPVESFLFGLRYALSAGVVTGLFMTLFGTRFNLYTIFGVNGFIFVFSLLGSNLRHSSIRLSYGRWLEYLFISPAQHQIHHSNRHYNYNYGGYLAIWDSLFGSLKRNQDIKQPINLGLGRNQYLKYDNIFKMFVFPFQEVWRKYKHRAKRS